MVLINKAKICSLYMYTIVFLQRQERLQNRTNRINEPPAPSATKEAPPIITKDDQPSASKENDPTAAAATTASVADEPYRQLLPDQTEEEGNTATQQQQQPRKRLLNFKIPLLNRGSIQRRNQGVSLVARRKLVRPHSPVPTQPTGNWWINMYVSLDVFVIAYIPFKSYFKDIYIYVD